MSLDGSPYDKIEEVSNALGSLANCLALVHWFAPGELVVHIEGSDAESLQDGLTRQLPAIPGVGRLII